MTEKTAQALDLVRKALALYTDTPAAEIQMDTKLADLQVDSLTLAELLFDLEDRVGHPIAETAELPQSIQDVVAMLLPHMTSIA